MPVKTNGFQDRLVMTTSIPLQGILNHRFSSATLSILTKLVGSVNSFFRFFLENFIPRKAVYFRAFRGICNKIFALCY